MQKKRGGEGRSSVPGMIHHWVMNFCNGVVYLHAHRSFYDSQTSTKNQLHSKSIFRQVTSTVCYNVVNRLKSQIPPYDNDSSK